jgi:hypothetical protein
MDKYSAAINALRDRVKALRDSAPFESARQGKAMRDEADETEPAILILQAAAKVDKAKCIEHWNEAKVFIRGRGNEAVIEGQIDALLAALSDEVTK